jgi:hypothetical protein
LLSTGTPYHLATDPWRLRMAEHGIAVKPSRPAKNSPAAACRSAGAGHCLVLALGMSWLLVVISACFCPLRRASKPVRRSAYGAPYRICARPRVGSSSLPRVPIIRLCAATEACVAVDRLLCLFRRHSGQKGQRCCSAIPRRSRSILPASFPGTGPRGSAGNGRDHQAMGCRGSGGPAAAARQAAPIRSRRHRRPPAPRHQPRPGRPTRQ